MIKIKIFAALISVVIASGFTASKIESQTRRAETQTKTGKTPAVETAKIKCSVEAYREGFASDEPKTSVVRAAPTKNSLVVKTVVTPDEVVYSISGSDGKGWFEISKIEAVSDEEATLFEGRGWIHSSLLATSVANADPKLRVAPNSQSRVVKKLIPDESEARPLSCSGKWMKVKSGKSIGWLSSDGQCANPLTTCP
jgi:type II secretory pathway component PulC